MRLPSVTEAQEIINSLSPRELEVVREIATGKKCDPICQALGINSGTYRSHKVRIKKKMGGRQFWGWPAVLLIARPEVRDG